MKEDEKMRTKAAMTAKKRKSRSGSPTPHSKRKGVRIELYLSEELASALSGILKVSGQRRAEFIREALEKACGTSSH